jgi:hypothetical protein
MVAVLSIATILGGVAAIWFFWDKIALWWNDRQRKNSAESPNLSSKPSRSNIEKVIIRSDPMKDWNHKTDSVRTVSSYKHDMNLRFETKFIDDGVQCVDFKEPWANCHPDRSATGYWCNLYYGSTLVDKFILVAVDGERAMLPVPKKGSPNARPTQVLPLDYKVAQIHDTLGTLREYMTRSGLSIYTETL